MIEDVKQRIDRNPTYQDKPRELIARIPLLKNQRTKAKMILRYPRTSFNKKFFGNMRKTTLFRKKPNKRSNTRVKHTNNLRIMYPKSGVGA